MNHVQTFIYENDKNVCTAKKQIALGVSILFYINSK